MANAADADAYLARLGGFAGQLDGNTERMQQDVAKGIVPPDFILDLTLAQMAALRVPAAQARVVQSLATRAAAKGIRRRLGRKGDRDLRCAGAARARPPDRRGQGRARKGGPRRWHLDGCRRVAEFYEVALRNTTTTRLSPKEVHQFGLDQGAEIKARMDAILRKQGMTSGTVGERIKAIADKPGQVYPEHRRRQGRRDRLLQRTARGDQTAADRMFDRMPQYQFEVRRVPPETEAGAASAFSAVAGARRIAARHRLFQPARQRRMAALHAADAWSITKGCRGISTKAASRSPTPACR